MLHGYFDLPTFTFWEEKNIWTGSLFQTFNYRIFRNKIDDAEDLCAVGWYGMKCFELTPAEEYKFEFHEEFSPEGLKSLIVKLNEKAEEYKKAGGKL